MDKSGGEGEGRDVHSAESKNGGLQVFDAYCIIKTLCRRENAALFAGKTPYCVCLRQRMGEREMQEKPIRENKMGVMPVNRLLLSMALPMMLSMLVQACYNIVDSIFVARLGEDALTAVSLAFPAQNLMIAVGTGTGVGINAMLSKSLGERDQKTANRAACNGVFLAFCSMAAFMLLGLIAVRPFYASQVAEQPAILEYGVEYLTICALLCQGMYLQFVFERLLQATGHTVVSMVTQMTGAITNIILDPILIFGLGPFPRMEVAGAAAATVIGQFVGAATAIALNHKYNVEIQVTPRNCFRPHGPTIGRIYKVGVPSIIMASIGSVMTYGMNLILVTFSSTATAVFGVYFKLQSFFFMPVFGLNGALVPIIAYNFGARRRDRMIRTIQLGILYAMCFMLAGLLIFNLFPEQLLGCFNASDYMVSIGVPALRTISYSFVFAGFCIACGTVFQALGNGVYSMTVSIVRQLVVLLPAAWLLAQTGELDAVWWSFPIAEVASLSLSSFFLVRIYRKIISKV